MCNELCNWSNKNFVLDKATANKTSLEFLSNVTYFLQLSLPTDMNNFLANESIRHYFELFHPILTV